MIVCNNFFLATLGKMQTNYIGFNKIIPNGVTMIQPDQRQEIKRSHENDLKNTGSTEYQIAMLSTKISRVALHIKKNPKDFSSIRGLVQMVNARKKLLRYIQKQSEDRFLHVCSSLKIRMQKK